MKEVLKKIHPDVIISTGGYESRFLPRIKGRWKTIREMHSTKHHKLMQVQSTGQRILARIGEKIDYSLVFKRYDQIVLLTQEDRNNYPTSVSNITVIPNPCRFLPESASPLTSKRVLAVGRLSYEKNFSSLIRAFSLVHSRFPDWSLDIFGKGTDRKNLSSLIVSLNLANSVHLMGNHLRIQDIMPGYSLLALSSKYEGFPLVLVEALSCGLPLVSYACPCGPKDIIRDGVDGFLVPPGNETMLAECICRLIEDENLRTKMGASALDRAKDYSIDRILQMWISLFEELMIR